MADEKKPKIDLKARLGKAAAPAPTAPTPAPAPVVPAVTPSGRPMPMPPPTPEPSAPERPQPTAVRIPTPIPPAPGMPVAPGYPAAPTGFDRANPLAAAVAAAPYAAQARTVRPAEPQRIEIDELTIQQASKSSLRKGILMGCVLAVLVGGVGYVAGGAQEQAASRAKSKEGAVDLATNAGKAKDQLKVLADKMEAGRKELVVDHKFPATLAKELGGINVDFDGKQLEGRRFSGFSTDTTRNLVEYITAVQGINDRKLLIMGLLSKLEKPLTEQFKEAGQIKISYVVAPFKDQAGNYSAALGRLVTPINAASEGAITLPSELLFAAPGGSNTKLPPYKGGDLAKVPAAMYVAPNTFDGVCPSAVGGQGAQLAVQLSNFINEVKGEPADPNNGLTDPKPGLLERADKLIKELGTVGS